MMKKGLDSGHAHEGSRRSQHVEMGMLAMDTDDLEAGRKLYTPSSA